MSRPTGETIEQFWRGTEESNEIVLKIEKSVTIKLNKTY